MTYLKSTILIGLALGVSACGTTPADDVLDKMHAVWSEKIVTATHQQESIQGPAQTSLNLALHVENKDKEGLSGTADISIQGETKVNTEDKRNQLIDATFDISFAGEMPSGTLKNEKSQVGAIEKVNLDLRLKAKTTEQFLFLNINTLKASGFLFPQPIVLTKELQDQWYGSSFEDIDGAIKAHAKDGGQQIPLVRDLIKGLFQQQNGKASLQKLLSKVHLWKGIERLPDEDNMIRIRVASDKKKIQSSVRALASHVQTMFGQSVPRLKSDDAEFMNSIGIIRGIMTIDKETFEWIGFDGDITDASGKTKGQIQFSRTNNDAHLMIRVLETDDVIDIQKIGNVISGTWNGKEILTGKASTKSIDLTAKDPETNLTLSTLQLSLQAFSPSEISVSDGLLIVPSQNTSMRLKKFTSTMTSEERRVHLEASGNTKKLQAFTLSLDKTTTPTGQFTIEKPTYKPFEKMYEDFLRLFINQATPIQESTL